MYHTESRSFNVNSRWEGISSSVMFSLKQTFLLLYLVLVKMFIVVIVAGKVEVTDVECGKQVAKQYFLFSLPEFCESK